MSLRITTLGGLRLEGDPALPSLAPRRMALLALLAAVGRRGLSRDKVIGILWPEAGQEQARHALAQTCYSLRQATGRHWITPGPELRLDPSISSDIGEWQEAVAARDLEGVVHRYAGPFLDGFYLTGEPEFERWVEEERARVHQAVVRAAEQLAAQSAQSPDPHAPLHWWQRLTELEPLSARYAVGYMIALAGSGDRASALAHGRRYQRLVRAELDAEADPSVRALVEELRIERPAERGPTASTPALPAPVLTAGPKQPIVVPRSPPPERTLGPRRRGLGLATGAVLVLVLGSLGVRFGWFRDRASPLEGTPANSAREPDSGRAVGTSTLASQDLERVSPEARLLYDQGLQAHFRSDSPSAYRLMTAALERDPGFAMAAYYAWHHSLVLPDRAASAKALDRVKQLAGHTGDRERLMIQASVAGLEGPIAKAVAIAETLAVRYPADPDGQLLLGRSRFQAGDWPGTVAAASRSIAADPAATAPDGPYCRVCIALGLASDAYLWWDSAGAAERVARQLVTIRPAEPRAWHYLLEPLLRQGRRAEAEAVIQRLVTMTAGPVAPGALFNRDLIRWGRLVEVDRTLEPDLTSPSLDIRQEARWLMVLSLRDQGRLEEALALARDGISPGSDRMRSGLARDPVAVALVEVDRGRYLQGAELFRREAERALGASNAPLAFRARGGAWYLTLAGVAHGLAGDTDAVRRLADSVEVIGRDSGFGRDLRLHHALRGLLMQMHGRHQEAVDAFRRSLFSLTDGYTRTNLMLARSLLALRRPAEAIAVLRPALRGGVDGSNSHVSRTELHEALAAAFEQAGTADSARAHHSTVARAWRQADPALQARYRHARIAAAPRSP